MSNKDYKNKYLKYKKKYLKFKNQLAGWIEDEEINERNIEYILNNKLTEIVEKKESLDNLILSYLELNKYVERSFEHFIDLNNDNISDFVLQYNDKIDKFNNLYLIYLDRYIRLIENPKYPIREMNNIQKKFNLFFSTIDYYYEYEYDYEYELIKINIDNIKKYFDQLLEKQSEEGEVKTDKLIYPTHSVQRTRLNNNLILKNKIKQEIDNPINHILDYSLIDRELTKTQIRNNSLYLVSSHGIVIDNDDIILKPGQRVISLKYFTVFYILPIEILRFLYPLFREWPEFPKLEYLTRLGEIKIGDKRQENKFYRKYGIYDGNITESRTLPNMSFRPLEQESILSYLPKEMLDDKIKKKVDLSFEYDPKLFLLDGGIMQVPISFTHKVTNKKLELSKIFDFKNKKINFNELKNHRKLFTNKKNKLSLIGNSKVLNKEYKTSQFYISPHNFTKDLTLRSVIEKLESQNINEFTLIILTCKELDDSSNLPKYKYFDLKEYMEYIKQTIPRDLNAELEVALAKAKNSLDIAVEALNRSSQLNEIALEAVRIAKTETNPEEIIKANEEAIRANKEAQEAVKESDKARKQAEKAKDQADKILEELLRLRRD
jgi:hypothetical protein